MRGSRLATERGVKARMIRLRRLVCIGWSEKISQSGALPVGGVTAELVLAVDGAREDPIPGVSGQLVVDAFKDKSRVIHKPDWQDAADEVARVARAGDIVMTLSCGDVYKIIPQLIEALESTVESGVELQSAR